MFFEKYCKLLLRCAIEDEMKLIYEHLSVIVHISIEYFLKLKLKLSEKDVSPHLCCQSNNFASEEITNFMYCLFKSTNNN